MSFETNLEIKQLKQGLVVWTITLRQSESGRSCLNCLKAQLTCGLNQNSSAILLNTWSWWGQRALRVTLLIHVKKLIRVPELQQNPKQPTSSHLLQCFWKMFSKNKTDLCRMAQSDCLRGSHTSLKPILGFVWHICSALCKSPQKSPEPMHREDMETVLPQSPVQCGEWQSKALSCPQHKDSYALVKRSFLIQNEQ